MRVARTLVALALVAIGGCGDDDGEACDGPFAETDVEQGHAHTVCVSASSLVNRARIAQLYTTSRNEGHEHQITLSVEQLDLLANGGTVTVTTTTVRGHAHSVTLTD